ncbi:MAG TPA: VWA domain-containing protein [Terriglobales bacterium]|nr:VWA domain-containing protein [Terriglobales bacterium]
MRLRSKLPRFAALLLLTFCAAFVIAQQPQSGASAGAANAQAAPSAQNPPAAQAQAPAPTGVHRAGTDNILVDANGIPLEDQSGKSIPQPATEAAATPSAPNVPSPTVNVPSNGKVQSGKNGQYTVQVVSEEVVLHATVVDQHQRLVTNLNKNDFQVYEDGQPQTITRFSREDIPVSIGILIDDSGSMRDKRQAVNSAALDLVKSSNPDDEVFVVNFSDEAIIDTDLTSDISKMKEGLQQIDSRGGTALYDAVVASADYLAKKGHREKKVLLVVTDGEDNASTDTLEQTVRRVQDDNGPMIYSIGILGGDHEKRAKRALEQLALQTGGVAFFPKDLSEVDEISRAVARDIRSQYSIFYRPSRPQEQGGYRQVKVDAHAPGYGKLMVRTRSGYYPGQQQRASR